MALSYREIIRTLSSENIESYVPDGVFYSRPVIGLYQDRIADCFFLYYYDAYTNTIGHPFARMAVDSENKSLVFYYPAKEKPFKSSLPENFVSPIKYDETYKKWKNSYERCYEKIRGFAFTSGIADEQRALLMDYWQSFGYITDKELKPFYAELSPEFWKWLKEACTFIN
jgi:hypothetical protein